MVAASPNNSPGQPPRDPRSNLSASLPRINAPLGFAEQAALKPARPTKQEVASYLERSRRASSAGAAKLSEIVTLAREALELSDRLEGNAQWSAGGAIPALAVRQLWAKQAHQTLSSLTKQCEGLFAEPSAIVLRTIAADFVRRLAASKTALDAPHASSALSAAVEQTRLMVIFAGRALKSEEHAQTALSALQERSFAAATPPEKPAGERPSVDRRATFLERQAAKAAASEAKRAALKAGGAIPRPNAAPKTAEELEKSELLAATAAQHRAHFETSRPTDEQRRLLRQRELADMRNTLASRISGGQTTAAEQECETVRIEKVNHFANQLKDWLEAEVHLATAQGVKQLSLVELLFLESLTAARQNQFGTEISQLQALQKHLNKDLTMVARAILHAPTQAQERFSKAELARLRGLLTPPQEPEIYQLAD